MSVKQRKNKKVTLIIIIIILILSALGVVGFIVWDNFNTEKSYKELATEVSVETQATETAVTDVSVETQPTTKKKSRNPIDFDELNKMSDEIIGWIKIPDTNVDYPIMQSKKSDSYYLHKDIYGNYKYAGSIYIEYCNDADFLDRVTLMYGHNMLNGSMFANLHKFSDTEFFNSHEYFYVYKEGRKLTYQVVSAYIYDDRHIMNSFNFAEDEVFENYLDYIQNPRSVAKNVRTELDHPLTVDDHILTLSTCLNGGGNGRYLLQGVLVKDESTG